ncbi:Pyruvate:ferredoxin oxidoreductase [Blattamonas nauphoetae]|uniref:Pyruvate:ferredoxin oxidoreductase n=1 Tax=Blattamonas nauphoetae TaxID=2049346 RepID=A0ABQ9YI13_9EUKA|nr:Pyruvate:ferredoxin oxidoreductase [Blattamonas nauphoetae]
MTNKEPQYANMDGDEAAALASYPFIETSFLYPITPATAAAEFVELWASQGKKNIFGQVPDIREMQAEGGCAGAIHGSGVSGTLSSTYTCSQGLLLMIPNMYKLAYEMTPTVFHVASRLVAHHAMSLYCDYSDVFACRDTGFAFLCSADSQECLDLGTIAHLCACKYGIPFLHFFDGLWTSHEIAKIQTIPSETLKELFPMKEVLDWKEKVAMSNINPTMRGCGQNGDIWWLCSEATAPRFRALPAQTQAMMDLFAEKTGRQYHVVDYYGAPDATDVIMTMGSAGNTCREVIESMAKDGKKVGFLRLRLFRPFPGEQIIAALPKTCRRLCVLDRAKQTTAAGEPLFLETLAAMYGSGKMNNRGITDSTEGTDRNIFVLGGKMGISGFQFNPMMVASVIANMQSAKPLDRFCVGINDDISHTSLTIGPTISTVPAGTVQAKFFGLGADGTVGSCKNAIKLIGENTDLYTQGNFVYDAKKTGGFTFCYLRFGKSPILSEYEIYDGDYVACHQPSFLTKFNVTDALKQNGIYCLNCTWSSEEDLDKYLPPYFKKAIAEKDASLYVIDAFALAAKCGLGKHINMIMSVCFFALANVIPVDKAIAILKDDVRKLYSRKGDDIVKMNVDAIDQSLAGLQKVSYDKAKWAATEIPATKMTGDPFIDKIFVPIARQEAQFQPVSSMLPVAEGRFRTNTARLEKRGVSQVVPKWDSTNCIQCNGCAFVCPHAVIRPFIFDPVADKAPETFTGIKLNGKVAGEFTSISGEKIAEPNLQYRIQMSARDCVGCGLCINECPKKCLSFREFGTEQEVIDDANWEFAMTIPKERGVTLFPGTNIKDTCFHQPLLEFHGACAGCTEPIHMKIISQIFGTEMFIANAVGCSMVWGGYTPTCPYSVDGDEHGPTYSTSLFEDNAEFALGMSVSVRKRRTDLKVIVAECLETEKALLPGQVATDLQSLLDNYDDLDITKKLQREIIKGLSGVDMNQLNPHSPLYQLWKNRDMLSNKTVWVLGGDGWAYDIDFHGIDHLLHSGEDVNIVIFDTEVYSNTGGQASKATPMHASAKLATSGKMLPKKDFGLYAMGLGVCYVASVCVGANRAQYIRAVMEAQKFKGPSILIAYCPCIAHALKGGLGNSHAQQRLAVESGYWPLFRFNPALRKEGKNPLTLDKECNRDTMRDKAKEFLSNELRFVPPAGVSKDVMLAEIADSLVDKADHLSKLRTLYQP